MSKDMVGKLLALATTLILDTVFAFIVVEEMQRGDHAMAAGVTLWVVLLKLSSIRACLAPISTAREETQSGYKPSARPDHMLPNPVKIPRP